MIRNYLKTAWRNMVRHRLYAGISISGLAVGLASCIVIYLIVHHEFSYDRFHPESDRIYRLMSRLTESTGDQLRFARVPPAIAREARSSAPGFEITAAIIPYSGKISIVAAGQPNKKFESILPGTHFSTTVFAEPQYFHLFPYHWLAGDPEHSLDIPGSIVLTEQRARQYFGNIRAEDIVGREVIFDDSLRMRVTGILSDWTGNSDLKFSDFISFSTLQTQPFDRWVKTGNWKQGDLSASVFAKLESNTSAKQANQYLADIARKHLDAEARIAISLSPLSDMHFDANIIENTIRTADRSTLYGLMAIAGFILLLAIINFINLSTALSVQRAKEVGVRKVLGSGKTHLTIQFLLETFLVTGFAAVLALALVNPTLSVFSHVIPDGLSFHPLQSDTILFVVAVTLVTTLLAGLYPARVLSAYRPVATLKGLARYEGAEHWLLRKGLIVFQFTVSIVFMIGSIVIAYQLKYTREKDPGFVSTAIINIQSPRDEPLSKMDLLAQYVKQLPGIQETALQWLPPMTDNPRGMKLKYQASDQTDFWVTQVAGDEHYIPLFHIKLLAGRNLVATDTVNEFVINESLAKLMGCQVPAEALGRTLYWNDQPYPVVGVVADFHTKSFHDPVTPLCIINRKNRQGSLAVAMAGGSATQVQQRLDRIKREWTRIYPASAFQFSFYEDSLAKLYERDRQSAMLVNAAMGITILISCIGLFGLALFIVSKRTKEIGVRKILGAGMSQIIVLLSREFFVMVTLSILVASPIAWYLMSKWLDGFVYRVHLQAWIFLLAGMGALLIAMMTVGFQAIRAALANPVKALRTE